MKLIFCPGCEDIRKIHFELTYCFCRSSWGKYEQDGDHAIYGGEAIPVAIGNRSFTSAIRASRTGGPRRKEGIPFKAWIVPTRSPTFKKSG